MGRGWVGLWEIPGWSLGGHKKSKNIFTHEKREKKKGNFFWLLLVSWVDEPAFFLLL